MELISSISEPNQLCSNAGLKRARKTSSAGKWVSAR